MRWSILLLWSLAIALIFSSNASAAPSQSDRAVARHRLNKYSLKAQRRLCEAVLQHYPKPKHITTTTTTVTPLVTSTATVTSFVATQTVGDPLIFDDPERRGTFQLPENLRCFELKLLRELCLEVFYGKVSSTSILTLTALPSTSTTTTTTSATSTVTQRMLPTASAAYCGGDDSSCSCTVVQTSKRVITCTYGFKGAPSAFNVPCTGKLQARLIGGGRDAYSMPSLVSSESVQRPGASTDAEIFKVGDRFSVVVGGAGEKFIYPGTPFGVAAGGFNGGGQGSFSAGGGGSTDLLLQDVRLLVAGGSGGAGELDRSSFPPDVDHQCGTLGGNGCNGGFIAGGGGGGLRGGAAGAYRGAGYGGSSLYSAGDLYTAQVDPSLPGFATGATLTYTCSK